MNKQARLRLELRPQGRVASACPGCPLFDRCGGIEPAPALFDSCFDLHCCRRGDCERVCPNNRYWRHDLRGLGGLRFERLPPLAQQEVSLPLYVPVIDHRYGHRETLDVPVAALKTSQVFRLVRGEYVAVADDPAGLRRAFRLAPHTRVVLRGTGKDDELERYWQHRRRDRAPQQMARLGLDLVIGPNFSHPLDVVRTETLANRMRQLICLREMQDEGLSPVPHLSAVQPADWDFWLAYLRDRPAVRFVAGEFQTGNKVPCEGRKVIGRVARIQDAIGRPLHLIAVGAGQYAADIASRLGAFTVLDSLPFMRAVGWREFTCERGRAGWQLRWPGPGHGIDALLRHNLVAYPRWLEARASAGAALRRDREGAGRQRGSGPRPLDEDRGPVTDG